MKIDDSVPHSAFLLNAKSHKQSADLHTEDVKELFDLRSPEVNEVLSVPPTWLIRWGISLIFGLILLLLFVSMWIRSPELVKGELIIVPTDIPKSVATRVDGRLIKLWVNAGDEVQQGQILAELESTAHPAEVKQLETLIDTLVNRTLHGKIIKVYTLDVPPFFRLGELQKAYQTFQEAFIRTKSFVGTGNAFQKRELLMNDLNQTQELKGYLERQIVDQEADFALVKADLDMNNKLLEDKLVSKVEYRQALSRYLNKKQAVEQLKSQLMINELSQNQKRFEVLELNQTILEQQNTLLQTLRSLKSDIEDWKRNYQVRAPISGKVAFQEAIQENQHLASGNELLYVLPTGTRYTGEMHLGQYNLGKVKPGQQVLIKFKSYPFEQFGIVKGQMESISELPQDSTYRAKVNFPDGLTTTANKVIPFRNGLTATAEIITDERSMFQQFFRELLRVFK